MRSLTLLSAVLLLSACGEATEDMAPGNDNLPAATQPSAGLSPGNVAPRDQAEAEGAAKRGAAQASFDWIGTYAATPALCTGGRWRFDRDKVVTDGETSCEVGEVEEEAERAVLQMACVAEGMTSAETWTLTKSGETGVRVERDMGAQTVRVDLGPCPAA